jgi:hypothetical protein
VSCDDIRGTTLYAKMLVVYRLVAVSAACGISEKMAAPAKLPDLLAEPRLAVPQLAAPRMAVTQAALAEQAGLEVARPVPPLAALVLAPQMAATLAMLAEQAGLAVVRPVPPLAALVALTVAG